MSETMIVKNRLLAALLKHEYAHLLIQMERVSLSLGDVVYETGGDIRHVYFPENSVVSMLAVMENGDTVEVGIVGREGMVGISIFLGGMATPDRAVVQAAGTALRMNVGHFRREIRFGSPLQQLLLSYTRSLLVLVSQSVACNQLHSVGERLSRWMLMMHDYVDGDELLLTQDLISSMLGSRRASISEAATELQEQGLISYTRGHIKIIDRVGLEATACECYAIVRDEFEQLYTRQIS